MDNKNVKDKYSLCDQCKGKCCQGVYITKKEYELLSDEYKQKLDCMPFMNGYVSKGNRCSLCGDQGCTAVPIEPFLDCKLYPLEIVTLDKLIINDEAKQGCLAVKEFTAEESFKKGY